MMIENDTYIYRKKPCSVEDASGVKGMLLRSGSTYFFRIYETDGSFRDYDLAHDDLAVTIDDGALASFYRGDGINTLDHSPRVFGLKKADEP